MNSARLRQHTTHYSIVLADSAVALRVFHVDDLDVVFVQQDVADADVAMYPATLMQGIQSLIDSEYDDV